MPKIGQKVWPTDKDKLFDEGVRRAMLFCQKNDIPPPHIVPVPRNVWPYEECAYYRPEKGIRICLAKCAIPAPEGQVRNWNWMGSCTDREPYGVVCHELAHHCDVWMGNKKRVPTFAYCSYYATQVMAESKESELTSYCPNPGEWFAEMFRLFITNAYLLYKLRPNTFKILRREWEPVSNQDWRAELGSNVPPRILSNLEKKL